MNDTEMFLQGEYFIGDLWCVFYDKNEYDEETEVDVSTYDLDDLYYLESELDKNKMGGKYTSNNFYLYWYKAQKENNTYKDNYGRIYPCMSGIIICFPTAKLSSKHKKIMLNASQGCLHIAQFQSNFMCSNSNGKVTFGDITIDTNFGYE